LAARRRIIDRPFHPFTATETQRAINRAAENAALAGCGNSMHLLLAPSTRDVMPTKDAEPSWSAPSSLT
jgi:hypothetical protein